MRKYKWTNEAIIQFCEPLAELLVGGMTLLDSLRFLSTQASSKSKKVLCDIIDELKGGAPFSDALKKVGAPPIVLSIVVCSEQNNQLLNALHTITEHYGQRLEWRRKWQQITIYPAIVLTTVIVCFFFLLTAVLPHFKGMYESLDVVVPESLLILIGLGEWTTQYGTYVIISFLFFMLIIYIYLKRSERFRISVIVFMLKIPLISDWLKLHYTQHVAFLMGFLLKSRLDILSVIGLICELSSSPIMKGQMKETTTLLIAGHDLSSIMRNNIYRYDFSTIIETGENAGRLPEMIVTYASNLKNLSYRRIATLSHIIQPALIVGIGAFIGAVILLLFMPVFGIINEL